MTSYRSAIVRRLKYSSILFFELLDAEKYRDLKTR